MDHLASVAASDPGAQNVQELRVALAAQDRLMQEQSEFEDLQLLRNVDRSEKNRMNDEIVSVLSDAMTIMKNTGNEVRNSGR